MLKNNLKGQMYCTARVCARVRVRVCVSLRE